MYTYICLSLKKKLFSIFTISHDDSSKNFRTDILQLDKNEPCTKNLSWYYDSAFTYLANVYRNVYSAMIRSCISVIHIHLTLWDAMQYTFVLIFGWQQGRHMSNAPTNLNLTKFWCPLLSWSQLHWKHYISLLSFILHIFVAKWDSQYFQCQNNGLGTP